MGLYFVMGGAVLAIALLRGWMAHHSAREELDRQEREAFERGEAWIDRERGRLEGRGRTLD